MEQKAWVNLQDEREFWQLMEKYESLSVDLSSASDAPSQSNLFRTMLQYTKTRLLMASVKSDATALCRRSYLAHSSSASPTRKSLLPSGIGHG